MTTVQPYGSWRSPVAPGALAAAGRKLGQLAFDGGTLHWTEGRPWEQGRTTVVCLTDGGTEDLVPAPFDVRSAVHEYGGGAYALAGGHLWFVNAADQDIYHRWPEGRIDRMTDAPGLAFADLQADPDRQRLIAVCEDANAAGEPRASLVAIAFDGTIHTLHSGRDFYASPRLSPSGERLVFLAWDHPDMPWDATELWELAITREGAAGTARRLAGVGESLFGPLFAPDGSLYVVADGSDWWNIHRAGPGGLEPVTREAAEFGLPQWVFSQSTCAFDGEGRLYALRTRDGLWSLTRVTGDGAATAVDLPFSHFEQLRAEGNRLAFIGASPAEPPTICTFEPASGRLLRHRAAGDLGLPESAIAVPEPLSYATGDGETAHALYYPPTNPDYRGPEDAKPPLLVKCHGGPTGATGTALDARIQFWTSRGFAVLDVNYRGSTGYGRRYRRALYGRWGIADVADCVNGARHLAANGRIDPDRVVVSGSSAGGYTVLSVLTFTELAAAGASYYGIGDLARLLASTHKFESRYLGRLVGEDSEELRARSPLVHADRLTCPVLFLQGLQDKVVPPDQAETMAAALRERGVPVAHITFAGERHGFKDAENIRRAIAAELSFYGRILGFAPADELPSLAIANLDD